MNEITHTNDVLQTYEFKDDYLTLFSEYYDAEPKTLESYIYALKCFRDYLLRKSITNPNRDTIREYRDDLQNKEYKPTTIHAYMNAIRRFFTFTEDLNLYPNIARNVRTPRIASDIHRKDALTINQARDLLNSFSRDTEESKRNYAIVLLGLVCGVRICEMARADIKDLANKGNYRVIYLHGKGHQEKDAFNKIPSYLDSAIRDYLSMRKPLSENEPLFSSVSDRNNGGRLTTRSISRIIKNALVKIGLDTERITPHSLRHFTATIIILLGGTLEETREVLRHANANTTLIYINENKRLSNDSELKIENALFNGAYWKEVYKEKRLNNMEHININLNNKDDIRLYIGTFKDVKIITEEDKKNAKAKLSEVNNVLEIMRKAKKDDAFYSDSYDLIKFYRDELKSTIITYETLTNKNFRIDTFIKYVKDHELTDEEMNRFSERVFSN